MVEESRYVRMHFLYYLFWYLVASTMVSALWKIEYWLKIMAQGGLR